MTIVFDLHQLHPTYHSYYVDILFKRNVRASLILLFIGNPDDQLQCCFMKIGMTSPMSLTSKLQIKVKIMVAHTLR